MLEKGFNKDDRAILCLTAVVLIGPGFMGGFGMKSQLQSIEDKLERPQYEMRVENVIGHDVPERFYEIKGKRVYLEIDGESVENYFRQ